MKLSDFDYKLPTQLVAQNPCEKRDASRLLVLYKDTGKIEHYVFRDLVELLDKESLIVLNDTKVFKARIIGQRRGFKGKIEILVLRRSNGDVYNVLAKPSRKITIGTKLVFKDKGLCAEAVGREGGYIQLRFNANGCLYKILDEIGMVPLPPYIKRTPRKQDEVRYQTVYAKKPGAIAAPTAGLHFTQDIINQIQKKHINITPLTLHVGYGTFKPVVQEDITKHNMHEEYYEINADTALAVNRAKADSKKIIAVGTTVCRALESACIKDNSHYKTDKRQGYTDIFIYPGYRFKMVDALLTNFHLPKTTLLMLVSAFAGRENIMKAYQEAVRLEYRFFSYGDAMLII
jgi:S-adenosylmethionine:tRNA ribosyltransferase-isomerase